MPWSSRFVTARWQSYSRLGWSCALAKRLPQGLPVAHRVVANGQFWPALQAAPFQVEQQLDPVLFTFAIAADQADDVVPLKENLLWVRDFETIERLRPLEL